MRRGKRRKELLQLYRRERARGFQARWALSNARTRMEWEKHEVAEYSSGEPSDPKRGNVRLRVVSDETCSLEDLEGDCFNPKANPDISASKLHHDRQQFIETVNREGVWGIIGEYFDGERWQHADSCFGFVGNDWEHSGYDTDIMRATLNEAKDARVSLLWPADYSCSGKDQTMSTHIYTPRIKETGERLKLELDDADWEVANRYRGTRRVRGTVTDKTTGKRYRIKGAACGLQCCCDAIAEEV